MLGWFSGLGLLGGGGRGVIRCFCGGLVGYVWFIGWSLLVGFAGSSLLGQVFLVRFAGLGSSGSSFERKYI